MANKIKVLVTGGAGYIGSCTSNILLDKGHDVTIIDNLSVGKKKLLPKKAKFHKFNIQNKKKLSNLLSKNNFDIVFHFAAFISVEDSVNNPKKYLKNNFDNTKIFLEICRKFNLKNIIFSSTAAVYGDVKSFNANENFKKSPLNPYAISKLRVEEYLINSKFFRYIILRYFNVVGADLKLRSGPWSKKKSTHLIKNICEKYLKKKSINIFGENYPSKDGTAIRDYIHVVDLAEAHILAANYLIKTQKNNIFNCGYGKGYTVKEVVNNFNKIYRNKLTYVYKSRRAGDPFKSVADVSKIKKILKWKPKLDSIQKILKSQLTWEKKINGR